ncbi:hypothetical protein [Gordonia sputi]
MDVDSARRILNNDLDDLRRRRERLSADFDSAGIEIGAITEVLSDLGQPEARSAEHAGVSPSHMSELVARARSEGRSIPDPLHRIPELRGIELQSYVSAHGGPVRVIASFEALDVLHLSRVDPMAFLRGDYLFCPHMLIQCADAEWTAVDNVQVGYGGTGPRNAQSELTSLGIDPATAEQIAGHRVSDVALTDALVANKDSQFTNEWPRTGLSGYRYIAERLVVPIDADGFGQIPEAAYAYAREEKDTVHGFYGLPPSRSELRAWLELLDDESLPWRSGVRRARVYFDLDAAQDDGYAFSRRWGLGVPATYSVIIEQGPIQLWLRVPRSNDPSQRYSPEVHAALGAAGFYTDYLDPTAGRGAFVRWMSGLGRTPPPYVDLDDSPLRFPNPSTYERSRRRK